MKDKKVALFSSLGFNKKKKKEETLLSLFRKLNVIGRCSVETKRINVTRLNFFFEE